MAVLGGYSWYARLCSPYMLRDNGREFYACLSGLKATTVDWSKLHSQLHASLTPLQVHILLEALFPCVMIHFKSQGAVLVARNRLLDVQVEVVAIGPEQSESSSKPQGKKRKVEERIPEILDVLGNALDELTDARAHKRGHDDVHHVGITARALHAYSFIYRGNGVIFGPPIYTPLPTLGGSTPLL